MKTATAQEQNYTTGIRTVNLPATTNGRFVAVALSLTRVNNWPGGVDYTKSDGTVDHDVVLVARMEFSTDGGANWIPIGEVPFVGGLHIDRFGNPLATAGCRFSLVAPNGQPVSTTGSVRAWFNVLVPLRTALTATAYEEGDL